VAGPGLSQQFLDILDANGYTFFTGVPCSIFTEVMRILDTTPRYGYVSAVREDSALGMAVGAWMGGRQPVVFMQNSGLAVATNGLTSLSQIYEVPALLVVSWRGRGGHDAPEHVIMGLALEGFLELFRIPWLLADPARLDAQVAELTASMGRTSRPVALVVPEGALA
jgi:phosphonopyruvate decarboxylase